MAQMGRAAWWRVPALATLVLIARLATPARAERPAKAEDPQKIVSEAVQTELAAAKADNTKWLYYETDRKTGRTVKQWVAQTTKGSLERVLEENGRSTSEEEQRSRMESYMHDSAAQQKSLKEDEHDDRESAKMLNMLPHGFLWNVTALQGENLTLHFKPNPSFHAPDIESRVFAATEGDMVVTKSEHRIVTIKGRMTKGVKFAGGLFGGLDPGGTFDVERRRTGQDCWQITETHIHIHGRVLFFKTISEQEDDEKTKFRELPANNSFQDAERELLKVP